MSPVIGTLLMVALVVVLAAVVAGFMLIYGNIDMKDTLAIIYNR